MFWEIVIGLLQHEQLRKRFGTIIAWSIWWSNLKIQARFGKTMFRSSWKRIPYFGAFPKMLANSTKQSGCFFKALSYMLCQMVKTCWSILFPWETWFVKQNFSSILMTYTMLHFYNYIRMNRWNQSLIRIYNKGGKQRPEQRYKLKKFLL